MLCTQIPPFSKPVIVAYKAVTALSLSVRAGTHAPSLQHFRSASVQGQSGWGSNPVESLTYSQLGRAVESLFAWAFNQGGTAISSGMGLFPAVRQSNSAV